MNGTEAVDFRKRAQEIAKRTDGPSRPVIVVRQELAPVTDEAIAALEDRNDLGVFVRTGHLVQVIRDGIPRDRWLKRDPGAPTIARLGQAQMLDKLDRAAEFVRFNEKKKDHTPARPPGWLADQVLGRAVWPLRYLDAVVETPTIRPDGSILDEPGYDEATGLLYEPRRRPEDWPGVPECPSDVEVAEALDTLFDPVCDFPFRADSDRAAYLAAVLSLLGRHLIRGPVPMFPVRSPVPGTGKGLLVSVIVGIGTGRTPAVMQMADADELRKRITALAMAGDPAVTLDDLSGTLASSVLASALTAHEWKDRILGVNQTVTVPLHLVWFATGNNLGFGRTLGRRVVPIDLDAQMETPEDRTNFEHPNLLAHVEQNRLQYVAAGLTILRGFHLAGSPPHGGALMGSFEVWDDQVRSAVVWAGVGDPAAADDPSRGRGRIRASADDDLDNLAALLGALEKGFPEERFMATEVIDKAEKDEGLRRDLELAAGSRRTGKVTARSLGYALRDATDRPVGGLILRADAGKRPRRYWVEASHG